MLITRAFKIKVINARIDSYLRKIAWANYLLKFAAVADTVFSELNSYSEKIKKPEIKQKVKNLSAAFSNFIEEAGPHKIEAVKDADKITEATFAVIGALDDIKDDPYTDPESDEGWNLELASSDSDFDPEQFFEIINKIQTVVNAQLMGEGEEGEEFDPANEAKQQVVLLLQEAKKDPEFRNVMQSGHVQNMIAFLKNTQPQIIELMNEIENINDLNADDWTEIMEDMSQMAEEGATEHGEAGAYQQIGGRIVDTGKQKEAKKVWIAKNPKKHFEQKQRDAKKLKEKMEKDPEFRERRLSKAREYYNKYYASHQKEEQQRHTDIWRDKQTGEVSRHFINEYGQKVDLLKEWQYLSPQDKEKHKAQYEALTSQTTTGGYNIQTLRNKFVVVAARDRAVKIAREIGGTTAEAFKKMDKASREALMNKARNHPDYTKFINDLPNELAKDNEFKKLKRLRPDLAEEVLNAVGRLRSK